jgi:enamine deaminase RidA (YjgF/YER057c/UK114 family)
MPQIDFQNPPGLPPTMGYSHCAKLNAGRLVFISGQVARDGSGALIGKDDFAAQVEQVFRNLKIAVEGAGGAMTDLVKLNYYCADTVDPAALPVVAEIRDRYVNTRQPPASTFVVVRRLVRADWLIEIEAVAAIGAPE